MDKARRFAAIVGGVTILLSRICWAADPVCYTIKGSVYPGTTPCNASADGTTGSHSTCCHRQGSQDGCLSSGLCLASWNAKPEYMLWAVACTDPSWKDPACAQVCRGAGGDFDEYSLVPCGVDRWCCSGYKLKALKPVNQTECCKNSFAAPPTFGTVYRQFMNSGNDEAVLGSSPSDSSVSTVTRLATTTTVTAGPGAAAAETGIGGNSTAATGSTSNNNNNSSTPAIVGGVLGGLLALAFGAIALLVAKNRELKRQLAPPSHGGAYPPSTGYPASSYGGTQHMSQSPPTAEAYPASTYAASQVPMQHQPMENSYHQSANYETWPGLNSAVTHDTGAYQQGWSPNGPPAPPK